MWNVEEEDDVVLCLVPNKPLPYEVYVDVVRTQKLCESRGEPPGLPVPNVLRSMQLNLSIASELRNCVKVDADVLGSLSLIVRTVSVDVKQLNWNITSELRNCVKVNADVLGSLSLIVRTVSVDVKQQ